MRKQRHLSSQIEQLESRIVLSSLSLTSGALRLGTNTDLIAPAEVQFIDDTGADQQSPTIQTEKTLQNSDFELAPDFLDQPVELSNDQNNVPISIDTRLQIDAVLRFGRQNNTTSDAIDEANDRLENSDQESTVEITSDLDSQLKKRKRSIADDSAPTDQNVDSGIEILVEESSLSDDLPIGDSEEEHDDCRNCSLDPQSIQLLHFPDLATSETNNNPEGENEQVASISKRENMLFQNTNRFSDDGTTRQVTDSIDVKSATQDFDVKTQQAQSQEQPKASKASHSEWDAEDVALAELFAITVSLPFNRKYLAGTSSGPSVTNQNFSRGTIPTTTRHQQGSGSRRKWRHRVREARPSSFSLQYSLVRHIDATSAKLQEEDTSKNRPRMEFEWNDEFFMTLLEIPDRQDRSNDSSEPILTYNDLAKLTPETIMAGAAVVGTGYFAANRVRRHREKLKSTGISPSAPRYTGPTVIR